MYAPISYILPSRLQKYEDQYDTEVDGGTLKQVDREKSLKSLMITNLLKRLESSVASFRLTLQKLQAKHQNLLTKIQDFTDKGYDSGISDFASAFEDIEVDEDDFLGFGNDSDNGGDNDTVEGKIQIKLEDMDLPSWQADLGGDLVIIEALLAEMQKITPADDTKLQHIKTQIESKLASPINVGNKKVIIFTAFADTANYLYDNLSTHFLEGRQLHTGLVTGSSSPKTTLKNSYDFQGILTLFSPRSKEKDIIFPNDPSELDILIGTDCISEGQNLQD